MSNEILIFNGAGRTLQWRPEVAATDKTTRRSGSGTQTVSPKKRAPPAPKPPPKHLPKQKCSPDKELRSTRANEVTSTLSSKNENAKNVKGREKILIEENMQINEQFPVWSNQFDQKRVINFAAAYLTNVSELLAKVLFSKLPKRAP